MTPSRTSSAGRDELGGVCLLARTLEAVEAWSLVAVLGEHAGERSDCDAAGHLPGGVTAHSVAHDEQGVEPCLVAPDDHRVLVLLPLEAPVGRRGDLKAHFRDG